MMNKKHIKNAGTVIYSAMLLFISAAVIIFPKEASAAVKTAAVNCLNTIIPSLFAMMVLSRLFTVSGLYRAVGKPFGAISRYVFRIREDMLPVFIVSCAAGYPVGAALIASAVENEDISPHEGEAMLCWCFGAGPAFICTAVGAGSFGSRECGNTLLVSCIGANIIVGILMGIGRKVPPKSEKKVSVSFTPEMLIDSVCSGGRAILQMCGVILFMSAVLSVPEALGASAHLSVFLGRLFHTDPYNVLTALRSAAEISNLAYVRFGSAEFLPCAAALLSFGGISVFMQIAAVCGGRIKIRRMIAARFACAAFAYIICGRLYGIMYSEACVAVMKQTTVRYNQPISALFLLIMTILLLSEKSIFKSEKM